MELEFKTKNQKQYEAASYWVDGETEEILYGGAKGGGKSFLGATLIFGDALIYPETHYFIARKELIDLRKFTVPTVHEVFKNWGLKIDDHCSFNGQDNCFNFKNGSKVFLIACSDVPSDPLFERFGSMQMTRGWIEEGGEVPENAKANLSLSIGRWKNDEYKLKRKLLITANPKKGWMKRDFVDPFAKGLIAPSRKYIQAFATDNVYLPEDYINALRNERDNIRRQRLWEGNWDYDEDKDSLVVFDALTDTFSNNIVKDGKKYIVSDIARLGRDRTVISVWDGLELTHVGLYEKQTTSETAQKIKDIAALHNVPYSHVLVDEDGVGGGVVDQLFGVKGFTANSQPLPTAEQIRERQSLTDHFLVPKTRFSNVKAQCAWKIAELINEHKVRFPGEFRDDIITELSALLRDKAVDSDGKKQLRPKDEVKQEIGRSPDIGDCIIMRAWFELKQIALDENPERRMLLNQQQTHFNQVRRDMALNSTK